MSSKEFVYRNGLKETLHNRTELKINQTVMNIFELISFEKDTHITLSIKSNSG
jgi:hypothetical protein